MLPFDEIVGRAGAHGREIDVAVGLAGEQDQRIRDSRWRVAWREQLQSVVLAEAIVDEVEIVLVADQRVDRFVERRDPVELERRAAAVGEQIAGEDEVVLIVVDEEDADDSGCRAQARRSGGSSTISIQ